MAPEQRQQPSGEEVVYARFSVHFLLDKRTQPTTQPTLSWKDEDTEKNAWQNVGEGGPGVRPLTNLVKQVVRSNLGGDVEVSTLSIRPGTIIIEFSVLTVAGYAVYEFLKNYPDLRQGVLQLRDDLRDAIRRFFSQVPPGGDNVRVYGSLTASPAMQRALTALTPKDPTTSGASTILPRSPDSGSGPLVWYLIISNAALLLFLAILLVWIVALWQSYL